MLATSMSFGGQVFRRHLGLMLLAPGTTYPGVPLAFAYPAALGDLLAALLALAAIPAVARDGASQALDGRG